MAFDLDAFRAAHQPWSFTVGGRTWHARHVSAPAVQKFEQLRAAAGGNLQPQQRALRWLLRRAFPWRLSYRLRGDPVTIILNLEPPAQREAIRDFFACLSGATANPLSTNAGPRPTSGAMRTSNGTPSSPSTPIGSA